MASYVYVLCTLYKRIDIHNSFLCTVAFRLFPYGGLAVSDLVTTVAALSTLPSVTPYSGILRILCTQVAVVCSLAPETQARMFGAICLSPPGRVRRLRTPQTAVK